VRPVVVREAWGSVGDMASAGRLALVVTDQRLLFFGSTQSLSRRRGEVRFAIDRRAVGRIVMRRSRTQLDVAGGALTIGHTGLLSSRTTRGLVALGAETSTPKELEAYDRETESI
jgi:hypothetical protein